MKKKRNIYLILSCGIIIFLLYYYSNHNRNNSHQIINMVDLMHDNGPQDNGSQEIIQAIDLIDNKSQKAILIKNNTLPKIQTNLLMEPTQQHQPENTALLFVEQITTSPALLTKNTAINNETTDNTEITHKTPNNRLADDIIVDTNLLISSDAHIQSESDQSTLLLPTIVSESLECSTSFDTAPSSPNNAPSPQSEGIDTTIIIDEQQLPTSTDPSLPSDASKKTIKINNNIASSMLTYTHWTGTYIPTKFIITANGVIINTHAVETVPIANNKLTMCYEYEFLNGVRTGNKTIDFILKDSTTAVNLTFSWKNESRFIIDEM